MKKISCVICSNEPDKFFYKGIHLYSQCANCKTVFCEALEQDDLVGGEYEVERNKKENYLRIERIDQVRLKMDIPKEETRILDFGCGNGYLLTDLKEAGFKYVDGYDAYNEQYLKLPQKEMYHVINCTECIEHMSEPFREIDVMYRSLVNYGCVILESGFLNVCERDNIALEDYFYIEPKSGHSTIFSHHGIDVLMCLKKFIPRQHVNVHVRIYQKVIK